jgi:hypothetical protein
MTTEHVEIMAMVVGHLKSLRAVKAYQGAHIYLFIEANMSWLSADFVAGYTRQHDDNLSVVSADASKHHRPGVWTGPTEKENYTAALISLLQDNRLYFAKNTTSERLAEHQLDLKRQLTVFRKEIKAPVDQVFGRFTVAFSGKAPGKKDDLVLALQICLYWMGRQRGNTDFLAYAKSRHWRV